MALVLKSDEQWERLSALKYTLQLLRFIELLKLRKACK
jgi:hypothetical protein